MTNQERAEKIVEIVRYAIEWRRTNLPSSNDEAPQTILYRMIDTLLDEVVDEAVWEAEEKANICARELKAHYERWEETEKEAVSKSFASAIEKAAEVVWNSNCTCGQRRVLAECIREMEMDKT